MLNLLLPTVEFPEGFTQTKAPQKNATEKFQVFGAIYKILRDPDARALLENGEKVDGNRTVQLELQKRDRFDRPIRMVLSIDSHGKLRHRFHKPSNCISILRIGMCFLH